MKETKALFIAMCVILVGATLCVRGATANPQTELYFNPTPLTTTVGMDFGIALSVGEVIDLFAWQAEITWDANLLECLGVTEGPFMMNQKPTLFSSPTIDNAQGRMFVGCTFLGGSGVSGSGTLAYIEFHCKGVGTSDLTFGIDTFLLDSNFDIIPCDLINGLVIQNPSTQTELYIDPTPVTVQVSSNFIVDVNIGDVTDLYGWEVALKFDPNQLECLAATNEPFLNWPTFVVESIIDNTQGTVTLAEASMAPALPVSGSGTLAHIEFHCKAVGTSTLMFGPDTGLVDSTGSLIQFVVANGTVTQQPASSVGGVSISAENLGILGSYVGVVSAILATTLTAVTYSKRVKHKK